MYDGGCGGGWMGRLLRYVKENNGIGTTSSYLHVSGSVYSKFLYAMMMYLQDNMKKL